MPRSCRFDLVWYVESLDAARRIASSVKVTYKNVKKPIVTWKDAVDANSYFDDEHREWKRGNIDQAINDAQHTVS